jgi:hypothetical protein
MSLPRKRQTRHHHALNWGPWADAHRWELGPEPDAPEDPMGIPPAATTADRRRAAAEVREWFAANPDA